MANIKDVAREAGVSVATVSRIMNNRGSISDKTRNKVYEVMKKLDYHPNEMARYLQTKRSYILGLVIPYVDHPFFGLLATAVADACYRRGYRLMLCTSGNHPDREQDMVNMLSVNQVDGILITCRADDVSVYRELNLPMVSIERILPQIPSISCDNYAGGQIAVRMLYESGCRKLLMISNAPKPFFPAVLRQSGFRDSCRQLNLPYEVYEIPHEDVYAREGMDGFAEILGDADGIFATGDMLAIQVYKRLVDMGRRVPEDVQLIGFDGLDISEQFDITTIAQPIEKMGELAVDTIIRCIEGQDVPSQAILPVKPITRLSTKSV